MRKKTRFKLKAKSLLLDFCVVFACLCVCTFSLYLFWKDLNATTSRTDKDAIATISFKYKVAQRKFPDRVVWERLQQQSPLYDKDTIRTADLASATITFKDGTMLDIQENSMLQIFVSEDGGVKLAVEGGGVEVDTSNTSVNTNVTVQMDSGTVVNLAAGSRLAAKKDEAGESNIQLKTGSGSVVSSSDSAKAVEKVVLNAGEMAKVSAGGQVKKTAVNVTSIPSELRVLNFDSKNIPVHLEWNKIDDENAKIVVETSKTKNFDKIESSVQIAGQNNFYDLSVNSGNLYWRVYESESMEEASKGRIRVEKVDPVTASAPVKNAVYSYKKSLPQINFMWNGNDFADHYKLEFSATPDFADIISSENITSSAVSFSKFDEGVYYWRVIPYYTINNIGYVDSGEKYSFKVVKKQISAAPMLASPAENAKLLYVENSLLTTFRWKSDLKNCDYYLVVAKDKAFENIVYEKITKDSRIQTEFNISDLPLGDYYWKIVRKSDEDAEENAESTVRQFSLARYVPGKNRLIYPPENFAIEQNALKDTHFVWKLADEYKNQQIESIVQICANAEFKDNVQEFKTKNTQLDNLKLESGKYFWRIGTLNDFTSKIEYSEAGSFRVLMELGSAYIIYPLDKQSVITNKQRPLTVEWKSVPGADYYSVKLVEAENGNLIKESSGIKANSFTFDELSPQKDLAVKLVVQPYSEANEIQEMRFGKTSSQNFVIRSPAVVTLKSPENSASFNGLEALREPVTLAWEEGRDKPERVQLVLQKLQASGNMKTVEVFENPQKSVQLQRLPEGSYRWTVNASMKDGTSLDAGIYNSFVIQPVQELNKVVLVEPSQHFKMDAKYLKKNRSLIFSWKPVENANDYSFVLFKKNSDGTLEKVYSERTGKSTSVKFKQLKLLDVGEFQWQVTAYTYAKDGFEEQHSKVSTGSFVIDIKLPGKVKTKTPGEMYGD